jgi:hypothetical protein
MKRRRSRLDWIIVGLGLLVFALVAPFTSLEKGLAAGTTFFIFATIIQTKSETRKESLSDWRFWLVISVLVVIHVVVLIIIKIPELKAGLISLPFALADGFVMWFLIKWLERYVFR